MSFRRRRPDEREAAVRFWQSVCDRQKIPVSYVPLRVRDLTEQPKRWTYRAVQN